MFGLFVILQVEQAFDILLEMASLIGLFEDFLVQVTSLFIVLLAVVLGSQLLINLDLLFLLRVKFLAFGWHSDLGAHRDDEGKIHKQEENPVSFHGRMRFTSFS